MHWPFAALMAAFPFVSSQPPADPSTAYVKKASRGETVDATLARLGLPHFAGVWHYAGPFENANKEGFATAYPPEKGIDLKATFTGKDGANFGWQLLTGFTPGKMQELAPLFRRGAKTDAVVYVYHEVESAKDGTVPVLFGADDGLAVWLNGIKVVSEDRERSHDLDQYRVDLKLKAGKNQLLLKVTQAGGDWRVSLSPEFPAEVNASLRKLLDRDFPPDTGGAGPVGDEVKYYSVATFTPPADCVLEVGGLAFRPDGKLLACTRRGDVWLIGNPGSPNPALVTYTKFATGLHEPLGMWVESNSVVYVVQRPELTKLTDTNGDGVADKFETVCDKWGVSGDYHEFAFGPARDKDGNFFVTLNVGFGGGHQSKTPWRGWCVKVAPDGSLEPWAYGLRSPNGVNFNPDGDLFYCDNQGEWVATNKMNHIRKGMFYGHQAGLRWLPESPFTATAKNRISSGMMYDGQKGPDRNSPSGMPDLDPPCIWFPYGRMGQSVSEPVWDTTGGKFGPFAGQCFVGDQTRSNVMRVALEKVNGVYQGACFPFRSGLQCGVNRLAFGPDGALYAGQTNRGWGSVGGKPYGLQRIKFAGDLPTEIHHVAVTRTGFDLVFTKPVADVKQDAVSLKSFTYAYLSQYGCPEMDVRAEKVTSSNVPSDRRTVSLAVAGLKPGRVYEFRLPDVKAADGTGLVHGEAYYTLNEVPK